MKHDLPPRRLFFNRRKEIDEIRRALGDRASRVLTITGAPSVGKTALALEIAWREAGRNRFGGGVFWLSGLTTAREAWNQISNALGWASPSSQRARSHLRDHACLLVLDALIASDAALEFVNRVASEETKVLVAGERLGLAQTELVWELESLELLPAFDTLAALWNTVIASEARQASPDEEMASSQSQAPLAGKTLLAMTPTSDELNADAIETARALADDYAGDGENETALAILDIALHIARQVQDKKREADCLTNIGLIYSDKGDLDKALDYHEQALALARALGNKQGEASDLGNIGLIYAQRGDLDKALDYHEQALALDRAMGYKQGEANQLGNIGLIYSDKGDLDKALDYHEQALALARALGNKQGEANQLGNIGLIYAQRGDLDKALEYFASALVVHGITADAQNITQGNIARIREKLGEREFDALAKRVTERLEKRFAALDRAEEAEQAKQFAQAARVFGEARETFASDKLGTFEWYEYAQLGLRQALALKRAGELLQALDTLKQTFQEFKRAKDIYAQARVCLEMGHVARQMDDYEDAWIHYTDAYRLFKRAGDKRMMAVAKEERGTLEFFFKSPDAAADLQEAFALYTESHERVRARAVEQMAREAQAAYAIVASNREHPNAGERQ